MQLILWGEIMKKALIILIVLFGVFLAIGCAGEEERAPNETGTPEQTVTPDEAVTPTGEEETEVQTVTEMKEYTFEELAEYDGKNGKAYVAYQGQVYDVSGSNLWENGTHKDAHDAGKNLTEEMDDAPHGPEELKDYPVVGTLRE